MAFTAAVVMFVEGLVGGGCIWLGFGLISCCYAYFVWRRIPFAAATLKVRKHALLKPMFTGHGDNFTNDSSFATSFARRNRFALRPHRR